MSGTGSGKKNRSGYTFNNTARLLKSGNAFFDALEELIDSAIHDIHFQTYIFEEDETGERIIRALVRAAHRGVKIFLLLDAYGSANLSEKFTSRMKDAGIEFRWFGRLFRNGKFHIGRRLHRKVVVADEFASIVSGINISNQYNNINGHTAWLDFGVLVKGDVSKKLYLICRQSWYKIRFKRFSRQPELLTMRHVEGSATVRIRPRQNDRKIGKKQVAGSYYRLIRKTTESITIVGGYFLPGIKARWLLKKASDRGVVIKLIIAENSDVGIMRNAMLYLYDWLLRNKIRIYEYSPSNVHGKVIIGDKKLISIGSCDMNTLSTYSNIELNLDIDDEAIAVGLDKELEEIIERDCKAVTPDIFKKRSGVSRRVLRWLSYRIVKSLFVLSFWLAKKEKGGL